MSMEKFRQMLEESSNIVFFGGAGVSTESNIPDFRSPSGMYSGGGLDYPPEYILSREFFYDQIEEFYKFYRDNMIWMDAEPNRAHDALVALERMGKLKAIITQNVDGLHQDAGSENVLELHGSIHRNYCLDCQTFHGLSHILSTYGVPKCNYCGGILKPDVVLYGESLEVDAMVQSREAIRNADMLIVGGTSLSVNPAANMVSDYGGSKLVLINKERTSYDSYADLIFYDSVGEILSQGI